MYNGFIINDPNIFIIVLEGFFKGILIKLTFMLEKIL